MALIKHPKTEDVKLNPGYYGSNMETLGAYDYRGYDIVVDNDMDMPIEGGDFCIGIYSAGDYDALITFEGSNFNLEKVTKKVDELIDSL